MLSDIQLLETNLEAARDSYSECAGQIAELEAKLGVLLKKTIDCASEVVPVLATYKNLKGPSAPIVSLQQFAAIKGQLQSHTKLAVRLRDEAGLLRTNLNLLKTDVLPKREASVKAAEEAYAKWTNVIPIRGR